MRQSYAFSMWPKIWSWGVIGTIVLFIFGGGVTFMTTSLPWIADVFYIAGSALFLIKFLTWEEAEKQEPDIRRRTSAYAIAGTLLVTAFAVWGNHYLNQSRTAPPPVSQQLPPNKPEAKLQLQAKPEPPQQEARQSKKTKEEPIKAETRNDLKLVFKNSPLFTDARKQRITRYMNLFYLYLIQIGFNAPKEVPPLGTYTKDMWFSGSQPIYEHSIFFKETAIDDPLYIARVYAQFAFRELLKVIDPDGIYFIQGNSNRTVVIYEDYYISSYFNKPPSLIGSYNWMAALWEIRQKFGKDFTDKMMYYAFKTIIDNPSDDKNEDFDLYFIKYLRHGVFILDNDRRNLQTIQDVDKILKSHVQIPSK